MKRTYDHSFNEDENNNNNTNDDMEIESTDKEKIEVSDVEENGHKLDIDAIWSKVPMEVKKNYNLNSTTNQSDVYLDDGFMKLKWYIKSNKKTDGSLNVNSNHREMLKEDEEDINSFKIDDLLNDDEFFAMMETSNALEKTSEEVDSNENDNVNIILCDNPKTKCKESRDCKGDGWSIISRQLTKGGKRAFAVTEWGHSYENYFTLPEEDRTMNELIPDDVPCKLYLDIDMNNSMNVVDGYSLKVKTEPLKSVTLDVVKDIGKDVDPQKLYMQRLNASRWKMKWNYFKKAIEILSKSLTERLIRIYFADLILEDTESKEILWVNLDASNEKKFSAHVIFNIFDNEVLFKSKSDVGSFIERFILEELERIEKEKAVNMFYNAKNTSKKTKTEDLPRKCTLKNIYEEMLKSIDLSIYTGEREFRMWESTKKGESRPLILNNTSSVKISNELLKSIRNTSSKSTLTTTSIKYIKLDETITHTESLLKKKRIIPDDYSNSLNTIEEKKESPIDDNDKNGDVNVNIGADNVGFDMDSEDYSSDDGDDDENSGVGFFTTNINRKNDENKMKKITFDPKSDYFNHIPCFEIYQNTLVSNVDYSFGRTLTILNYSDVMKERIKDISKLTKLREDVLKNWMVNNDAVLSGLGKNKRKGTRRNRNIEAPQQMLELELDHEEINNLDELDGNDLWNSIITEIETKAGLSVLKDKDGLKIKKIKEYMIGDDENSSGQHRVSFSTNVHYCEIKNERYTKGHAISSEHNNNNIYFVVDLNNHCFWQKCHNVECKRYYAKKKMAILESKLNNNANYDDRDRFRNERSKLMKVYEHQCKGVVIQLSKSLWNIIDDFVELTETCREIEQRNK